MFNSSLKSSLSGWFGGTTTKEAEEQKTVVEKPDENVDEKSNTSEEQKKDGPSGSEERKNTENDSKTKSTLDKLTSDEMQARISEETQKMMTNALSFGNYLFGVASEASKKMSEKVTETATTIKKTVEEKSIIGDLNREQQEFLQKKRERQFGDASVPPWVGYQESESMKEEILALSKDKRNFLRNPPTGVQFNFDFDHYYPIAMATLKEDENLQKMRFDLVPKNVKEEVFWRNYFYRVSLIKQSAQLSTLAEMNRSTSEATNSSSPSSTSSAVIIGSTNTGTISRSSSSKSLNKSDSENNTLGSKISDKETLNQLDDTQDIDTGAGPEFVSDDFDPSGLNPVDLEREMKQLGMEEGALEADWEKELQKELMDYEVVQDEEKNEAWEKEIEDMLKNDVLKK